MATVRRRRKPDKNSTNLVRDTLDLIRKSTRNRCILDAAGALACYAKALEGQLAQRDHAAAVQALAEKGAQS